MRSVAFKHTTVLIADENALVRHALKVLVTDVMGEAHFREASDYDSLSHAAQLHPTPRLALIDAKMPGMMGGYRLLDLARRHPGIPMVVISTPMTAATVRRITSIQTVRAFISKSLGTNQVLAAIQAVLCGEKLSMPLDAGAVALTPRQREIRDLLRLGMTNKAIARALGISEGTVKNHVTAILRALKATNRTQAARLSPKTE